jgi:hypothetical protein
MPKKKTVKDTRRDQGTAVKRESPFAKYQGIGNPGIPSGRAAVIKFIRDLRGE